jgi:hypothetical protein
MRYKDDIQCAGAELLALVREDAKKTAPQVGLFILLLLYI